MKKTWKLCIISGILVIMLSACTNKSDIENAAGSEQELSSVSELPGTEESEVFDVIGWGSIDDVKVEKVEAGILGETQMVEISKDDFYDKALAGLIGHVAGVASGYEFIKVSYPFAQRIGAPCSILEDLTYGPYGGGENYNNMDGLVKSVGENHIFEDGVISSDDDYHVDIFNQTVIQENMDTFCALLSSGFSDDDALAETYQGIKSSWLKHQVSDWGGGGRAMYLMNLYPEDDKYAPPYTGTWESGNVFHWCTEAYIENETLGINLPGMPQSAAKLANVMGSVTGDGDSLTAAEFWSAAYANAFFYANIADLFQDTIEGIVPRNSWLYEVAQKCRELYVKYPDDNPINDNEETGWRKAAREFAATTRDYYDIDDFGCAVDLNFGLAYLSVLYGQNDYETTAKISSVMGADSDCYTAAIMGIFGIMNGMDGTPQIIRDRIYKDGEGVYVNDEYFTPYIMSDYPEQQKFVDIARQYQENAEAFIKAMGGTVTEDSYLIPGEENRRNEVVLIDNADFELGTLENWAADVGEEAKVFAQTAGVYDREDPSSYENTIANTGEFCGTIQLSAKSRDESLYTVIDNLEPGATYKITAYIAGESIEAELFAQDGKNRVTAVVEPCENANIFSGYWGKTTGWYLREIYITPENDSILVGLTVR